MWSAEKRAEGLEYMHPKPSSHSGVLSATLTQSNYVRVARYTFGILRRARFEKGATSPEALTLAIRLRRNHDSGSD